MKLLTWNINSVRLRLPLLQDLATETEADVLCLQETKSPIEKVPVEAMAAAGYPHHVLAGFKGYNGVAIFSRHPLVGSETHNWCGKEDARHVAAGIDDGIRLHNLYIPAGGDIPDVDQNDKFKHKLDFIAGLTAWFAGSSGPQIIVGDLNIAPLENDVWSHKQLLDVVSHTPIEVAALKGLQDSRDFVDTARQFVPETEKLYTWWSYRNKDWRASNRGRRLDHIWVTPDLADRVTSVETLDHVRDWTKTSDHAPIVATFR